MVVDLVAQLVVAAQLLGDIALLRPVLDDDRLLVDGGPVLDLILELVDHKTCVCLKVVDHLTRQPTAVAFHKGPGQVVVVEGHDGLDIVRLEFVDEIVVELESGRVDGAGAIGDHARPGDAKTVGLEAHLGHEGHILAKMMIVVACDVGRGKAALLVDVLVDDILLRGLLAVLVGCALYLVGARCGAPKKALGKGAGGICHGCLLCGWDAAPTRAEVRAQVRLIVASVRAFRPRRSLPWPRRACRARRWRQKTLPRRRS